MFSHIEIFCTFIFNQTNPNLSKDLFLYQIEVWKLFLNLSVRFRTAPHEVQLSTQGDRIPDLCKVCLDSREININYFHMTRRSEDIKEENDTGDLDP